MTDDTIAHQYNEIVLEWGEEARSFTEVAVAAAQADAKWKVAEAKVIVFWKRQDPRIAIDYVRALALVDEPTNGVPAAQIFNDKLVAEAKLEGLKKKLQWNAARADNLRTQVVDERNRNAWESQRPSTEQQPQWGQQGPKEQAARERRDEIPDGTQNPTTFASRAEWEAWNAKQQTGANDAGEISDAEWDKAEQEARAAAERAAAEATRPSQPSTPPKPTTPPPAAERPAPPSPASDERTPGKVY